MSHYIYEPEAFIDEASKLASMMTVKQTSDFNNYRESDRLIYIQ